MTEECWLCLRVTPKQILEYSHRLFPHTPQLAHEVGMKAAELLKSIYLENPPALCGKSIKGLAGGSLYIVCLLKNQRVTQCEVAKACDVSEVCIRNNYQQLAKLAGLTLSAGYQKRRWYVCPICGETETNIYGWQIHLELYHYIHLFHAGDLRVKDFDNEGNLTNQFFLKQIRKQVKKQGEKRDGDCMHACPKPSLWKALIEGDIFEK